MSKIQSRLKGGGAGTFTSAVGTPVTVHPATLVGEHDVPAEKAGRTNLWPEVRYFGSAAFEPHEQGAFRDLMVVEAERSALKKKLEATAKKVAAASATARVSFLRWAGSNRIRTAATTGVNVMTLRTGKFIIHLLEKHDHSFVDYIQDPCWPNANP